MAAKTRASISSTLSSTQSSNHSVPLFPEWLEQRTDFQVIKAQYEALDLVDCYQICLKSSPARSDLETLAVTRTLKKCQFFGNLQSEQLRTAAKCLHSIDFEAGARLMTSGEPADRLYLLLKGKVGVYIEDGKCAEEVSAGNVVGEAGIQSGGPRSATVIAHSKVQALYISSQDFDKVLYRYKFGDSIIEAQFLRKHPFFAEWTLGKLFLLTSVLMIKQYSQGQSVFQSGVIPHCLYIIKEGSIELSLELARQQEHRWPCSVRKWKKTSTQQRYLARLTTVGPGELLAAEELRDNVPLRVSAKCVSPSALLYLIRKEHFWEIFSEGDRRELGVAVYRRPETRALHVQLEYEKRWQRSSAAAMLKDLVGTGQIELPRLEGKSSYRQFKPIYTKLKTK